MKKNFLTGLAILLPIALTLWILSFLMNLLTNPFIGLVKSIINRYHLWNNAFGPETVLLISRIAILITLCAVTLLIGFFARRVLIKVSVRLMEGVFQRIPIVNKIYQASKDVVHTLFSEEKKSFSQVVLVPFPHPKSYSMGLITSPIHQSSDPNIVDRVAIFVPGTPNPTVGFMVIYPNEQLTYLNTSVEEAFKFIISMGSLPVPINDISRSEDADNPTEMM